jgi:hypothetical protein
MCTAGMYDKQNNEYWPGQKFKIRFQEDIHDNWFKSEEENLAHHTLSTSHKYNSINNTTDILKILLQSCNLGLLSKSIYKYIWKTRNILKTFSMNTEK